MQEAEDEACEGAGMNNRGMRTRKQQIEQEFLPMAKKALEDAAFVAGCEVRSHAIDVIQTSGLAFEQRRDLVEKICSISVLKLLGYEAVK